MSFNISANKLREKWILACYTLRRALGIMAILYSFLVRDKVCVIGADVEGCSPCSWRRARIETKCSLDPTNVDSGIMG